ncbi:M-phase inducer phosphatase [Gossypium australe]|uniref:M-phase inducer phosphatase n=1 Tax=Gossypium australe TaxID=47621 RepID=A0A5B6W2D8_9ROSI|nr:M-phase inducer phosphatase [Gossypium australe]
MASIASPSIYSYCTSQDHNKRISTVPRIALCQPQQPHRQIPRREIILRSSELAIIGAIFSFSGKRPDYLGVQKNTPALALCPSTKNCISTSENVSDITHYTPPWNYNGGRTRKKPVSREMAMEELLQVIKSTKPDKYTPKIVEKKDDYVLVEYESPILGIVDDVEFWFPPGKKSMVEYRSASRIGDFDFDVNRKRIKALRMELEKKGWASEASF